MKRTAGPARKGASLGISLLMLTLSLAISLLDGSEPGHRPVVESEHDPARCPTGHDHTICTQVGANLSAPSRIQEHRLAYAVVPFATPTETPTTVSAAFSEGHPARAPPLT